MAVALVSVATTPSAIPVDQTEILSVVDPRPLAAAVALLERRCKCPISYEDPVYEADPGPSGSHDGHPMVPRGGHFRFRIALEPGNRNPDAIDRALADIIDSYAASGYPGTFHVERTSGMVGVVPQRSVLSAIVEVAASRNDQSAFGAIDTALHALRGPGAARIELAAFPTNLLKQTRVVSQEMEAPLQSVLVNILSATHRPLSWRLLYDIETRQYFLNIHSVK